MNNKLKLSNFFEYFQIFHPTFRVFSNVLHDFSNIFERFQLFLNGFFLPVLPKPHKLTHPNPIFTPKINIPTLKIPSKPHFSKIQDNFSPQLKVVIEVFGPAGIVESPPSFC